MNALDRPITESYWVEPGRLLAGEYPGYADDERTWNRLDAFLRHGFDTYIDLTHPMDLPPYLQFLNARAEFYKQKVNYHRFPIVDRSIPHPGTMRAILNMLDASLANGHRVYVHCWGGVGRTGTAVGCYLVRHGRTGEQALAQLAEWWKNVPKSAYNPRTPETDRQVEYILNWKENPAKPTP